MMNKNNYRSMDSGLRQNDEGLEGENLDRGPSAPNLAFKLNT